MKAFYMVFLGQAAAYSLGRTFVHPLTRHTDVSMASISRREVGEVAAAAVAVSSFVPAASADEGDKPAYQKLSMQTTEGEMQFELWDDVAPKHVASFLKLTKVPPAEENPALVDAAARMMGEAHAPHPSWKIRGRASRR